MSNNKKPKSIWQLFLNVTVVVFVIAAGCLTYKNKDREWANWTGFGEIKVITTTIDKNDETTVSEQIHPPKTLWNLIEISLVPILLATLTYIYQRRDKEKERKQAELEREIAGNNLSEELIQDYFNNIAKFLINKQLRKKLFTLSEQKLFNLENEDNSIKSVVRVQTITILRRLENDKISQKRIIDFLQDAELYKFILTNANLSDLNLSGLKLNKVNLQKSNLKSTNLDNASLIEANLSSADLKKVNPINAQLNNINLSSADLSGANFEGYNFKGANFTKAKLFNVNLNNIHTYEANFSYADIGDHDYGIANFNNADLNQANFSNANLLYVNFKGAYLASANFSNAEFGYIDFSDTNLSGANFGDSNLANLNFKNARFGRANLSGLDLSNADLSGASFIKTNLSDVRLNCANLNKAYLVRAKNLTPQQIKSACNWEKAIYKSKFNQKTRTWDAKEPDNTEFIEELKKDKSSNPKEEPDCSHWKK